MNILDEIKEVKKTEVKLLHRDYSYSRFADSEFFSTQCMSLKKEIKENKNISIIAEIKQASPSKGILNQNFNHLKIADIYFENEVNCISVVTDKSFFKGDIYFLRDIAKYKIKPILRKDFIIDEYQILEAKSCGADVILLIAELLSPAQIKDLSSAASETGMEVLLELHSEDQIFKIDTKENDLIGINNRDLITFNTDVKTTAKIRKLLPGNPIIVSESGIDSSESLEILKDNGVNAVLVGEYLMKSKDLKDTLQQLKDWCER